MVRKLGDLYHQLKEQLSPVSDAPEYEAREILLQKLGAAPADILMNRSVELDDACQAELDTLVKRRLDHEPLQYLLGEWSFYGRSFLVGEGVLIPRPDTEILAETVLSFLQDREGPLRVLELCGGSGCLAATIALEQPRARVWSLEKSPEAFSYLTRNCERLRADVCCVAGDALDPGVVEGDFDCILSNPPYLSARDMAELSPEVQREPFMALYGEEDGLFFYRELTRLWKKRLKPGGMLAYEIGMGQQDDVADILTRHELTDVCQVRDYGGIIRVLTARLSDAP